MQIMDNQINGSLVIVFIIFAYVYMWLLVVSDITFLWVSLLRCTSEQIFEAIRALRDIEAGEDSNPGQCGYGSIPINTIFRGMNIHKSQLF